MYKTVQEIQEDNESIGHKFFRNEWYCQVADPTVYGGAYFITKERLEIGSVIVPESFTIRYIRPDKTIGTHGTTGQYETLESAQESAKGIE